VQLDQMTQQNAALVEESAAAAESLKDQALRLTEVVSVFRLGEEERQLKAYTAKPRKSMSPAPSAPSPAAARPAPRPAKATPAPTPMASPAPKAASPTPKAEGDDDWQSF